MTEPKRPRMSEETILRHAWSAVVITGLVILAVTLGGQYGLWASGALLLLVGGVFAVPLWRRHLEEEQGWREREKAQEELAYPTSEEEPEKKY